MLTVPVAAWNGNAAAVVSGVGALARNAHRRYTGRYVAYHSGSDRSKSH